MPINLTLIEIRELQEKYRYLINYESSDPEEPIDPTTYVDSNGDHLLHIAAQRGDSRTAELLLKAGVDVNRLGDMNNTALHYARAKGHSEVANLLLAHGANLSLKNSFGELPAQLRE